MVNHFVSVSGEGKSEARLLYPFLAAEHPQKLQVVVMMNLARLLCLFLAAEHSKLAALVLLTVP